LLALGVGLGFVARRRTGPAPAAAAPAVVDPTALAVAQLAALDVEGDVLVFHTALAEIVRNHLAARLGHPVAHLCTEELANLHPGPAGAVQRCLWACDLVKFAAQRPPPGARRAAYHAAQQLVAAGGARTGSPATVAEASA
jgi:hypothetical protein